MKHFALFIGLTTAFVASCSIQEENFGAPQQDEVLFYASFEQPSEGTKVYANEDLFLRWNAGDQVSIYKKNTSGQMYKFNGKTGDSSGEFSKCDTGESETGEAITDIVSVYPYHASRGISESEVLTVSLPSIQSYVKNSFGQGDNTMVSVSTDSFLQFKNVGGYLRISLYGAGISVSSITLKGNNGEILAGKASVTMPLGGVPSVKMEDSNETTISLSFSSSVQLGETEDKSIAFWFVIPPVTFSKGFTITIIDDRGRVYEKTTLKKVTIERSKLSRMASIEVSPALQLQNNVIYYTTTDGNIIEHITNLHEFQGELLSNEYVYSDQFADDRGVLTFSQDVTTIASSAFSDCTTLLSMTLPESVTRIGYSAFSGCKSLSSISIPEGVTVIESSTFSGCSSLTGIIIPEGVTGIGDSAFYECTSLRSIVFPNSLLSIGPFAFGFCETLTKVNLPSKLTTIKDYAFYNCSSLFSVTLAKNLTSIGEYAFGYCSSFLSVIVMPRTPPTGGPNMFIGTNNCPILVFVESIEAYLSAPYWKDYADRIKPNSTVNVESVVLDKTNIEVECGKTESLTVSVVPVYATNTNVFWSSSDESVATVSSSGEVKGIRVGSATVTVTTDDGGKTASCNVTVLPHYSSTDYSRDGEVVQLQHATVGRGVNIILMGDGFVDKDMSDGGLYDQRMTQAMEQFFAYEPYTTFRNRFNVFTVRVVSKNAEFDESSERTLSYNEGESFYLRSSVCFEYGDLVPNANNQPLNIAVICNTDVELGRSFCSWSYSGRTCCIVLGKPEDVLNHELGGHGFAYLQDEYVEFYSAFNDFDSLDSEYSLYGWGANVDWRQNPSSVRWSRLLNDSRYSEEGLGIIEGARRYAYGVYRSTENSMMGSHYLPTGKAFNAPSREQIYKTIMKYSEGQDWQYDYETFVFYDAAGRKQAKEAFSKKKTSSSSRRAPSLYAQDHIPPIIINQDVKAVGVDENGKVHIIR